MLTPVALTHFAHGNDADAYALAPWCRDSSFTCATISTRPMTQGAELADLEAARAHAIGAARSLMCETLVQDGRISLHHRIDIENEHGEVLAPVHFAEAVRIER